MNLRPCSSGISGLNGLQQPLFKFLGNEGDFYKYFIIRSLSASAGSWGEGSKIEQSGRKDTTKKSSGWDKILERLRVGRWNVYQRRLPKEIRGRAESAKSQQDVEDVVEQRVQQGFREGDFDKLRGSGKPLPERMNPHIDAADELTYRVLRQNGFAPEWVELNKEIRMHIQKWRSALQVASGGRTSVSTEIFWKMELSRLQSELGEINKKVKHYNLIVPFGRQVPWYNMEREIRLLEKNQEPVEKREAISS